MAFKFVVFVVTIFFAKIFPTLDLPEPIIPVREILFFFVIMVVFSIRLLIYYSYTKIRFKTYIINFRVIYEKVYNIFFDDYLFLFYCFFYY